MKEFLKKLFCRHEQIEVICWYWTHGINAHATRFIEVQLKCKQCGKCFFIDIRDPKKYDEFIHKHVAKYWTDTCRPVL